MTWHPTNWRPPQADKVRLKFRNGETSKHLYSPKQINWSDRGWDFDVVKWRIEG
jgi:hypothetical protein